MKIMHRDRLRPCNDRFIYFCVRRDRQKILDSDDTLHYADEEDIDMTLITAADREAECSGRHGIQSKSVDDTTPTSLTATSQPTFSRRGRVITKPPKYYDYERWALTTN